MAFHAGERFGKTIAEIKRKTGKSYKEVANFMGIEYPMLTLYRKMPQFSNVVMHKVRNLEDWGYNSKHYTDEKEPRLLPIQVEPDKSEKQLISELRKQIAEQGKELELLPELKEEIEKMVMLVGEIGEQLAEILPAMMREIKELRNLKK